MSGVDMRGLVVTLDYSNVTWDSCPTLDVRPAEGRTMPKAKIGDILERASSDLTKLAQGRGHIIADPQGIQFHELVPRVNGFPGERVDVFSRRVFEDSKNRGAPVLGKFNDFSMPVDAKIHSPYSFADLYFNKMSGRES